MRIPTYVALLLGAVMFAPGAGHAATDTFSRLLTSGAWCSLRPGADGHKMRVLFRADGGYAVSSEHRSGSGHWKVKGGVLYMGEGDTPPASVATEVRRARRGFALILDGTQFVRCK